MKSVGFLENNAICYFVNWLYIRTHNRDYLSVLLSQYQTFSSTDQNTQDSHTQSVSVVKRVEPEFGRGLLILNVV